MRCDKKIRTFLKINKYQVFINLCKSQFVTAFTTDITVYLIIILLHHLGVFYYKFGIE